MTRHNRHLLRTLFILLSSLTLLCYACARTGGGGGTVVTTTATPLCTTLDDTTAGLTIDSGTTLQDAGVNEAPVAQCTSCASGTRQFYTSTTATVPSDAIGNGQVSEGVQCPDPTTFCTCNSAGVCCTPGATAPDTVLFIPFCSNGVCVQDVVVQGNDGSSITCTDGTSFTVDGTNADAALGTSAYFQADSVSCSGCSKIQNDQCQLPTIPVTSG